MNPILFLKQIDNKIKEGLTANVARLQALNAENYVRNNKSIFYF